MPRQAEVRADVVVVDDVSAEPRLAAKESLVATKINAFGIGHPSIVVKRVTHDRNDVPGRWLWVRWIG